MRTPNVTPQRESVLRHPDVTVQCEGSISLLHLRTDTALTWVAEHIPADAQYFGDALVVEHRYVVDVVMGMISDGLKVA